MPTQFEKLPEELQLATANHVKYIQSLDTRKDEYDYWLTEHLRLNGVYWGLIALHLLGHPDALPRDETIDFVLSCQHESGGFGAAPGHDAHMLYTVSAVQILAMVDAFDVLEERGTGKAKVGECKCQGHPFTWNFFFFTNKNLLCVAANCMNNAKLTQKHPPI